MIKVSNWAATARSRVIGIGMTVLDPLHRMFQSWFVVRRGGYGYIGAFRPKGWRIFEYDDDEKLYETIHLFGEEEVIVKEEASVNTDVEKYDIYGSIKDSADFCTNLIVEPIYYLGHESGINPGGVYRRTISRYDAGYAATLLEWFKK